jgi:CheY-like chemotaxis protein
MILIVDDNAEVAKMMVEVCRDAGYYADFALDGPSALYKVSLIRYALIFIDIILGPSMSGNTLAQHIKTLPHPFGAAPLISMSGIPYVEVTPALFISNLTKPFLPKDIREAIQLYANPPIPTLHLIEGPAPS